MNKTYIVESICLKSRLITINTYNAIVWRSMSQYYSQLKQSGVIKYTVKEVGQ
jgi:hypothetical protein